MRHGCRRSWCDPRSPRALPCGFPERSRISLFGPLLLPGAAKAFEEGALAVHFGVLLAQQHLLQRKHALRALHVIELQAPVDRFEQLPGILAVPYFRRGDVAVLVWNGKYSRQLLETIDWCLELDHLKRPQSVFALQKVLLREKDPEVHRKSSLLSSVRSALKKRLGR